MNEQEKLRRPRTIAFFIWFHECEGQKRNAKQFVGLKNFIHKFMCSDFER